MLLFSTLNCITTFYTLGFWKVAISLSNELFKISFNAYSIVKLIFYIDKLINLSKDDFQKEVII